MKLPYIVFWCLPAILLMTPAVRLTQAEPPPETQAKDEFVNVLGGKFRFPSPRECKAVVLIFVGHDCPISNAYTPEIVRICKEYTPKKVIFCVVYADSDLSEREARQHAQSYGYTCPAILDPELKLARKVGATVKPEAAVLSSKGELLYRGRINDLYIDFGKKRFQPTKHDLREALEAVLAGRPVPQPRTQAVGCYIHFPDANR